MYGDLGTFIVSGLGVVGIWAWSGSIPGACRRPDAAGDLGKLCGDLGTFKVSGLGAVGIWVGGAAFRAPKGARTLLGI